MAKIKENPDRWIELDEATKLLNWSPEDADFLINGLSLHIARSPIGRSVINLRDIRKHLVVAKRVVDSYFKEESPPKDADKVKRERKIKETKDDAPKKTEGNAPKITGKEAAKILNCDQKTLKELIEKYGLPAEIHGRGYYINPDKLKEFSEANQELLESFKAKEESIVSDGNDTQKEAFQKKKDESEPEISNLLPIVLRAALPVGVPQAQATPEKNEISQNNESPSGPAIETVTDNDPIENKGNTEAEERDKSKDDPPATNQTQNNLQTEPKQEEAINFIEKEKKENIKKEEIQYSYVSIKKTQYGCKIEDVAYALNNLSPYTVKKWIEAKKVAGRIMPGTKGDDWFIEPESLSDFLLKERNTIVTFIETKGIPKILISGIHHHAPSQ